MEFSNLPFKIFEMDIMTKKLTVGGLVTVALFAGIAGCSRTPTQTNSNDIFAPTAVPAGPVSEPIVAAIPVAEANTVSYAPQPVVQDVYQPVPLAPPVQQAQVAPLAPVPTIVAPPLNEAPLAPPTFDCDNIPTSKSGLTRYRESCL